MISGLLMLAGAVHIIIAALPFLPIGKNGESLVSALARPYNSYGAYQADPWASMVSGLGEMATAIIILHVVIWVSFALISFGLAVVIDRQAAESTAARRPSSHSDGGPPAKIKSDFGAGGSY